MARLTKKLYEAFQAKAAQTIIDEQTGDKIETKGGVFTKADIEAIEDERTRSMIMERYVAYVAEAKEFNEARKRMSEAKWKLQNGLDRSFIKLGYITRSFYWTILGLDEIESIVYRDSDKNYRERYLRSIKEKGKGSLKERGTDWGKAWDMAQEDIAELDAGNVRDISEDTPQPTSDDATLPPELDSDPEAFLTAYRRKRSMATKLAFYRDAMTFNQEERVAFFGKLSKAEQTALYQQLNQQEKNAVFTLYTAQ